MTATEAEPRVPNLLYSDVEEQLRGSVRDLLGDRVRPAATIAAMETRTPYDPALWSALGRELGVAGLAIAEDAGGHGASWREFAVVAEEIGRAIAPVPYLGTALATAAAEVAQDKDLLGRIASGEVVVTIAASLAGSPHDAIRSGVQLRDGTLHGAARSVIDAPTADVLLVPARDGDTTVLVEVAADAVWRSPVSSLDMTRPLSDLTFDATPGRVIASGAEAEAAIARAWAVGSALLASEQLGIAQQCLDMIVSYLGERYQFGRQLGSFQALRHRAADLWAAVTQARAVARYVADCVTHGDPDSAVAISLAQAYCSPVAVRAAEECVQLHGGIGFTWEHPAHLYLKRAKADSVLFGSAGTHRARLGGLVGLPPS